MTEREFYSTCLGFKRKELNHKKELRRTQWLILNSFADQKKLPRNESKWMPLPGDVIIEYKAPPKEILKQWDAMFRNSNKKLV